VKIELTFKRNTAYPSGFSSVKIITCVKTTPFNGKEEAMYLL
jgi:hypothetical protein